MLHRHRPFSEQFYDLQYLSRLYYMNK